MKQKSTLPQRRTFIDHALLIGILLFVVALSIFALSQQQKTLYGNAITAPTESTNGTINTCGTITQPGTYDIIADFVASSSGMCITINADDVAIKGNNHFITVPSGSNYAFFVNMHHGINISDITLSNFKIGVRVYYSENLTIDNITFHVPKETGLTGVGVYGAEVYSSNFTTFTNLRMNITESKGIYSAYSSQGVLISNSIFNSTNSNIILYVDTSYNVTISNTTVNSNGLTLNPPLLFAQSTNILLTDSKVYRNSTAFKTISSLTNKNFTIQNSLISVNSSQSSAIYSTGAVAIFAPWPYQYPTLTIQNSTILTQGNNSLALSASLNDGILIANSTLFTNGTNSTGAYFADTSGVITSNSTFSTAGDNSAGLFLERSLFHQNWHYTSNFTSTTTGTNSSGLRIKDGTYFPLTPFITTTGPSSQGILLEDSDSSITYSFGNATVHTSGTNSFAIDHHGISSSIGTFGGTYTSDQSPAFRTDNGLFSTTNTYTSTPSASVTGTGNYLAYYWTRLFVTSQELPVVSPTITITDTTKSPPEEITSGTLSTTSIAALLSTNVTISGTIIPQYSITASKTGYMSNTTVFPAPIEEGTVYSLSIASDAPPVITSFTPSNNTYKKTPTVSFSATVTDDNLQKVELYINGALKGTSENSPSGPYTFTTTFGTNGFVSDGNFSWYMKAYDTGGLTTTSGTRFVVVDTTAPIVGIPSEPSQQYYPTTQYSSSVPFEGTVTDYTSGISGVQGIFVKGSETRYATLQLAQQNNAFTSTWSGSYPLSSLPEGTYSAYINATDNAGNKGTRYVRDIIIDKTPPRDIAYLPTTPPHGGVAKNWYFNTGVTFTEEHMTLAPGAACELTGFPTTYTGTITGTSPNFTCAIQAGTQYAQLPEGVAYYIVQLRDLAQNIAYSQQRIVTVDYSSPTLSLLSTSSTGTLQKNSTITYTVAASDAVSGISKVVAGAKQRNTPSQYSLSLNSISGGYAITTTPENLGCATNGPCTIEINATDSAEHTTTITTTITIDSAPPTIRINEPLSTKQSIQNLLNVTITDANTITSATYNYTINYTSTTPVRGSGTLTTINGMNWTAPLNLGEGFHALTLTATDTAGNSAQTTLTEIAVDSRPPIITLHEPSNKTITNKKSVTFNATVTDSFLDEVHFTGYTSTRLSTKNGSSGVYNFAKIFSNDEVFSWRIDASDELAQIAISEQRILIVDVTPPSIAVSYPRVGFHNDTSQLRFSITDGTTNITNVTTTAVTNNGAPRHISLVKNGSLWNGDGSTIPEGNTTLFITATDEAGNVQNTTEQGIILDKTPPILTILTPAGNLTTNHIFDNPFVATALDENIGQLVFRIGDDGTTSAGGSPIPGGIIMNMTLPIENEGIYEFYITASDQAGNTVSTENRTVIVDATPPIITVNQPSSGQYANLSTLLFDATDTVTSIANVTARAVTNNGVSRSLSLSHSGTSWTANISSIPEGNTTLLITATDEVGNVQNETITDILVDNAPPILALVSPVGNVTSKNSILSVTVTASDGNLAGVNFKIDGTTVSSGIPPSGSSTLTTQLQLTNGIHALRVEAYDTFGNTAVTNNITITIDTVPPTGNFSTMTSGYYNDNTTPLTINATASDNLAVASVRYRWELMNSTTNWTSQWYNLSLSGTPWTATTTAPAEKTYALRLNVTDRAGNSYTGSILPNITIDRTPPTITLITPLNGENTTSDSTIITVNVTDEALKEASLLINNVSRSTKQTNGGTLLFSTILDNGTTTWSITAKDKTGNTARSQTRTITRKPVDVVTLSTVCGTITNNVTLNSNVSVKGTCFTVGTDNILINGNGYTITGDGLGTGIIVENHSGIHITNITLHNFTQGILLNNTTRTTLSTSTINTFGSNTYALNLNSGTNITILSSTLSSTNSQPILTNHANATLTNLTPAIRTYPFITGGTGTLDVQWYVALNTTSGNSQLPQTTITARNTFGENTTTITGTDGTTLHTLSEIKANRTTILLLTPHTITATKTNYTTTTVVVNLTQTNSTTLQIPLPPVQQPTTQSSSSTPSTTTITNATNTTTSPTNMTNITPPQQTPEITPPENTSAPEPVTKKPTTVITQKISLGELACTIATPIIAHLALFALLTITTFGIYKTITIRKPLNIPLIITTSLLQAGLLTLWLISTYSCDTTNNLPYSISIPTTIVFIITLIALRKKEPSKQKPEQENTRQQQPKQQHSQKQQTKTHPRTKEKIHSYSLLESTARSLADSVSLKGVHLTPVIKKQKGKKSAPAITRKQALNSVRKWIKGGRQ